MKYTYVSVPDTINYTAIIIPPALDFRREGHIPATRDYKLSEMFTDLVQFAVRYLVVGGRLVYWVPIILNE